MTAENPEDDISELMPGLHHYRFLDNKKMQCKNYQKNLHEKHLLKQKIQKLIDELIEYSANSIIIVEGKRDKIALEKFNITGRIEILKSESLSYFSEIIASYGRNIIILTDWDRRGDMLALKIKIYLQNLGINPDNKLRTKFKLYLKKEIKDVESLYNYFSKLDYLEDSYNEFPDSFKSR